MTGPANTVQIAHNQYHEQYIDCVNCTSFAQQSADSIFTKQYQGTLHDLHQENSLYIIVGSDSGLLIKYVIKNRVPKGSRYVFIEPEWLLNTIRQLTPEFIASQSISLCSASEWAEQAERYHIDSYIFNDGLKTCKSVSASEAQLNDYNDLSMSIERVLERKIHSTKSALGISTYMTTQLLNISENQHPASLLNNSFSGKTCVILGGGPSLQEHIEWIRTQQDNMVIIAVSRIAGILLAEKLTPHIIFSVDPQDISFDLCKDMMKMPPEVLFIHANHVSPKLISQWHGKSVYLGDLYPWAYQHSGENIETAGPTVTNTAIQTALEMGFTQILLAGVDLCFSQNGTTHTTGTPEANAGPVLFLDQKGQWVDTYSGKKALSNFQLMQAISELSIQAEKIANNHVTLLNLSENAAKVSHIAHLPATAISTDPIKENPCKTITRLIADYCDQTASSANEKHLREINKVIKELDAILALSKEAIQFNKKLYKKNKNNEYDFKFKGKIDKIQNKLDSKYQQTTAMLKRFGFRFFTGLLTNTNAEEWTDKELQESGRAYYQAYIDSIETILPLLKNVRNRILSRLEETSTTPSITIVAEQWKKDQQFGRAKLWQDRHSDKSLKLSTEDRSTLETLVKINNSIIDEKHSAYDKIIDTRVTSGLPSAQVHEKILCSFKQNNSEGILQIINALASFDPNDPQPVSLLKLSQAYLMLLQDNSDEALSFFAQVRPEDTGEDDLKTFFSLLIATENYLQAETVLGRLAQLSDQYAPKYAKILKFNHKLQESIETYTHYLNNNPEDIATWQALGELFLDADASDLAKMAFSYILERDAQHQAAIKYLQHIENGAV